MLMTRTLLILSLITSLAIGCGGDDSGTHVDDPDTTIIDDDAGPDAEDPDTDAEDPDADTDADDTDVEDPDTDVEDPDTDVDPVDEFGTLSLTVEGLPDGAWPELTLSGDQGDIIIGEGDLIEDLAAGEYELSAAPFTLELATYEAAPVELTIEADRTTEVTLNFARILASLNVIIEGLPPGVDASVDVVGDDGTDRLTESTTLIGLAPGSYTVIPALITEDDLQYQAAESTLELASGDAQTLTVSYALIPGELVVGAQGLPSGLAPVLTITGPDAFETTAEPGDTLEDLSPGTYTLSGSELSAGGEIYRAEPATVDVVSGDAAELSLTYALILGHLEVVVEGLPAGVNPDLTLTNPAGNETTLTQAGTLTHQAPGTYTLVPNDVTSGPAIYRAQGASVDVTSDQTSTLTVTYAALLGELRVSASGLPNDVAFNATLVGPAPSTNALPITGDQTLDNLAPGTYALNFAPVSIGDDLFDPSPATLAVIIESAQSAQASTSYQGVPGTFTLAYDFPGTGSLTVRVSDGESFSRNLTLSGTGTRSIELEPGSYELTLAANGLGTDPFGNPYNLVAGIDVGFSVASGQTVTSALTAPSPTEVFRGDDNGRGSLREVIGRVVAGSVITFVDGLTEVSTDAIIVIGKEISIVGPGPDELTLTTTGGDRLFSFGPLAEVHLEGLRIADITTDIGGGAIYSQGTFSLRDMVFDTNQATDIYADGGAISIAQTTGDIVIEDTVFTNNQASFGGAVDIKEVDHHVYFDRVRFEDNFSLNSGGAIHSAANTTFTDAVFTNNSADTNGGALYVPLIFDSTQMVVIERALFANNTAMDSGGAVDSGFDTTLKNVTFTQNTASTRAGAYYQFNGDATLTHVTFADNSAPNGSAIASFCDSITSLTLKSSVVTGQGDLFDCRFSPTNIPSSLGYNYIQTDSSYFIPDATTDQVGTMAAPLANPLLALADNGGFSQTLAVNPMSINDLSILQALCTDATGQPLTDDQRAIARPVDGFCTAGAFQATSSGSRFETFSGHGLGASSYTTATFTTDAGFTWHVNGVRSQGSYPLAGEGLMFRQAGDYVRSGSLSGGVDQISVEYRKAFTGAASRQIAIAVNGTVVATSPLFGDFDGADDSVFTLTATDLNISGDFTIEIRNLTPSDGQVVIDNLSWH